MRLYESVYIIRQDVSSADVDRISDAFVNIIKEKGGDLVKQEYWGLRTLAYEINNNRKGHYVLLAIKAPYPAIVELERKMRLSEDVIRFMTINVEEVSEEASPILRAKDDNIAIDVTSI